jgi:hypothetical protein
MTQTRAAGFVGTMNPPPVAAGQGVSLGLGFPMPLAAGYIWAVPLIALPLAAGSQVPSTVAGGEGSALTDGLRALIQAGVTDRDNLLMESVRIFAQSSAAWPGDSDRAELRRLVEAALAESQASTGSPGKNGGGPGPAAPGGVDKSTPGGAPGLNPVSISTGPDDKAAADTTAGSDLGGSGLALNPVASSGPPDGGGAGPSGNMPATFGPGRVASEPDPTNRADGPLNPVGSSQPPGTLTVINSPVAPSTAGSRSIATASQAQALPTASNRPRGPRPRQSAHPKGE